MLADCVRADSLKFMIFHFFSVGEMYHFMLKVCLKHCLRLCVDLSVVVVVFFLLLFGVSCSSFGVA